MQSDTQAKIKTSLKAKVSLIVFGFFLFFILLEIVLRLGGFVLSSIQEYRNLQTIKQKGAYRIMCLGESTTAGQYPVFLEEILNQRNIGIKFSVINKGIASTNTTFILADLESNINIYQPDMIVTMMGINDSGTHLPYEVAGNSRVVFFLKSFRTYKLARLIWLHVSVKAREIGFSIPEKSNRDSEENQNYLSNKGLKEAYTKLIATEESLKKSVHLNPNNYHMYFSLGLFYENQGRFVEAEDSFKKVLELNPRNERAYIELGVIYRRQDKFIQAEASLRKVLELNPRNDRAYIELGWIYRRQDKFIQAEDLLKNALELSPENERVYSGLGRLYYEQEKFTQAEESFKKVIQLTPKDDNAYIELGQLYQGQGKFALAEELFNQALKLNPKNDRIQGSMLALYGKTDKLELARKHAKEARKLRLEYYLPVTVSNYRKLKEILDRKGIRLVCMQYLMRSILPLRKIFDGNQEGVIFVDNEKIFNSVLKKDRHDKYFKDMFGGDFGHCTIEGDRLLAENAANVILREVFNNPGH